MASGAASSNPGASQPGATSSGAPVEFAVGSFNVGLLQGMLRGKSRTTDRHFDNFARVVATMVEMGNLDIVFGCEVGGHRQGCRRALQAVIPKPQAKMLPRI